MSEIPFPGKGTIEKELLNLLSDLESNDCPVLLKEETICNLLSDLESNDCPELLNLLSDLESNDCPVKPSAPGALELLIAKTASLTSFLETVAVRTLFITSVTLG